MLPHLQSFGRTVLRVAQPKAREFVLNTASDVLRGDEKFKNVLKKRSRETVRGVGEALLQHYQTGGGLRRYTSIGPGELSLITGAAFARSALAKQSPAFRGIGENSNVKRKSNSEKETDNSAPKKKQKQIQYKSKAKNFDCGSLFQ